MILATKSELRNQPRFEWATQRLSEDFDRALCETMSVQDDIGRSVRLDHAIPRLQGQNRTAETMPEIEVRQEADDGR